MALKGSNILLLVDNGTGFIPVGEQTNLSDESTRNLIEVTSKDDNHQKFLPGKKGDTIELEAFYVPDDAAYGLLKTAHDNGELIVVHESWTAVV